MRMTNAHRLDDEKIELIRCDTARQMAAFQLITASLAARLPATLRPCIPELARGLCADMAKQGYMFQPARFETTASSEVAGGQRCHG